MGSGSFDTKKYYQAAEKYNKQEKTELFQQARIFSDFDPLQIKVRESCASKEHPHPTSIIIACDVTGSMGKIPENLLKGGLGKIMESLLKIKAISNPQVMFAAIGDTEYDTAPLQVTQFESDNRIEAQLKNLYLEGGGGGNLSESYQGIWYFAAHKTQLDLWKEGKKGILFTMGDELLPNVLKGEHIRKFIDKTYKGTDILTSQLLKELTEKYDVFHLIVQDTNTYRKKISADKVNGCWQQNLGERAILVSDYTKIPEKIVSTVQSLCEFNLQISQPIQKGNPVSENRYIMYAKATTDASAVLNKSSDNVPHLFICPISQEVMKVPVIAEDGFTYERESITTWFQNKSTSPMTNEIIGKLLIPNHSLKSEIEQWQESRVHSALPGYSDH
jgi:U-box domain